MRRRWLALGILGAFVALAAAVVRADDKKVDATLKLSEGSFAAGIGWSWGHGTLTYKGKAYKVKVEGLSVGEVGLTNVKAKGNVYNLNLSLIHI